MTKKCLRNNQPSPLASIELTVTFVLALLVR